MQGIWTGPHFQLIHVLSSFKVHLGQFLALKLILAKQSSISLDETRF
jgi:hypothetical protein